MQSFNKVFRSADGTVFTKISPKEAETFRGNYITVQDGKAVAVINGNPVAMPQRLFNEIGVEYRFVNFYEHGCMMAKKHGIYFAVKQEPIRVWPGIKPGESIKTVIDGYEEHSVTLDENSVAAQNVIKNEFYALPRTVLVEKYKFVRHEFDYDLYEPKADVVSQWVYSDVNVFGVLWGGLEFLTTPMINITDPADCYGCNYIVWWGNDGRLSSYRVCGYWRGCGRKYYPDHQETPQNTGLETFRPPKVLLAE